MKACRENGAHLSINYKQQNFADEVLTFTGNKGTCTNTAKLCLKYLLQDSLLVCITVITGADVIIDFIGASYWENHTRCVAVDGRIVLLGLVTTVCLL